MDIQELKQLMSSAWDSETETTWQNFHHKTHQNSGTAFLDYLFQEGRISSSTLESIFQAQSIEISAVETVHHNQTRNAVPLTPEDYFSLEAPLGQGAMGVVHLAKDRALLRKVALKSLLTDATLEITPAVIRRFLHEVQITAQLDHPNIVPIYQLTPHQDGSLSYAMKLVHGKTFKELISESREFYDQSLKPDEDHRLETLLEHFIKVCDALNYAHSKHVIHRDLKPANIMIGPHNDVYVMDWGIAKHFNTPDSPQESSLDLSSEDPDKTMVGQIMGTLRYMSPQQAAGKNDSLDGASDQFALGLILFEILTLKQAIQGHSQIDILKKILKSELSSFVPYHPLRPIPKALKAIVKKATQKKVAQRYESVAEMTRDIRRYMHGEAVLAYAEPLLEKGLRWMRKHARATLLGALASFLILTCVIGLSLYIQLHTSRQAQKRAQVIEKILTATARQAQIIDREFLRVASQIESLASASEQALAYGKNSSEKLYFNPDFEQTQSQPADFTWAETYQRKISLNQVGIKLAPGVQKKELLDVLLKLQPLKHRFYRLFQASMDLEDASKSEFEQQFHTHGAPLVWGYLALKSGAHLNYPGKGNYPEQYDPRLRPWYQEAMSQKGLFWGSPYLDASGQGMMLPCLKQIEFENKPIGVIGLEMRLNYIQQKYLHLNHFPTAKHLYLLTPKGQIMLKEQSNKDQKSETQLKDPELLEALHHSGTGYIRQKNQLWSYYRLNTLGWYLLVEIDSDSMMNA